MYRLQKGSRIRYNEEYDRICWWLFEDLECRIHRIRGRGIEIPEYIETSRIVRLYRYFIDKSTDIRYAEMFFFFVFLIEEYMRNIPRSTLIDG